MTDAEISRHLALAIGWQEKQNDPDVILELDCRENTTQCKVWFNGKWQTFDYRNPAVIWPIAERYNCFPKRDQYDDWFTGRYPYIFSKTAAKAVALAVIKAHEGAKE